MVGRPDSGMVGRPDSGMVGRPDSGMVGRPDSGRSGRCWRVAGTTPGLGDCGRRTFRWSSCWVPFRRRTGLLSPLPAIYCPRQVPTKVQAHP